ncbi:hypothetical protein ACFU99_41840, partial [Streptomyces sp. NPDC057654]|uniref:hypothetical protein n=1 Tax=Streptomyces sp. NPDC057654 TaxID=3346196 RepID=UPI0036742643
GGGGGRRGAGGGAGGGRREGLVVPGVPSGGGGWTGAAAQRGGAAGGPPDEVVRRYGDVPVCLIGTGMGARAALRAAGHPAVNSVLALGPWLPDPEAGPESVLDPDNANSAVNADIAANAGLGPDPVKQLAGRQVLIAHGTNDARTDPDLSYRLAERAKKVNRDVCRFEVHSDGHALHQHRSEVTALAVDFMLGSLFARGYSRPVADALAAPPPLGLRMPLAAGFGSSLQH